MSRAEYQPEEQPQRHTEHQPEPRTEKQTKVSEGVATWRAATEKLAPLLDQPAPGDIVHRALPPDENGINPSIALTEAMKVLSSRYSDTERRKIRHAKTGAALGLSIGPAMALLSGQALEGTDGFLNFVLGVTMLVGALSTGLTLIASIIFVGDLFFFSAKERREAAKTIDDADLSGLVTVINPDPPTAFALERARTFAENAVGDLTATAYEHYYDLVREVAHGSSGTAAGTRADQWADAWRRWCAIDDAWTDIVCDPLSALTHSELLDVTLPRTEAFVTAFAEAKDAMSGRSKATTPVDLSGLLRLVDTVENAWVEARDHAEHAGYQWLPEAERSKAATAEKALTRAMDTRLSMGERANAAAKASRLFEQITTVLLPEKARTELASIARKALPAATVSHEDHTNTSGPILSTDGPIFASRPVVHATR